VLPCTPSWCLLLKLALEGAALALDLAVAFCFVLDCIKLRIGYRDGGFRSERLRFGFGSGGRQLSRLGLRQSLLEHIKLWILSVVRLRREVPVEVLYERVCGALAPLFSWA
jgi:hypothetical protein